MGSALQLPRFDAETAIPDTVIVQQTATELEVQSNPTPPFLTPKTISVLRLDAWGPGGSPGPGLARNARKRPLRAAAPGNASKGAAIKSPQPRGVLKRWIGGRAAPSLCPRASPEGWGHVNAVGAVWCTQRGQAVQGRRDAALAGVWGGSAPGMVPWRASGGLVGGAAAPGAWLMRAVVIRLILEDFSFSALSGNSWCPQNLGTNEHPLAGKAVLTTGLPPRPYTRST